VAKRDGWLEERWVNKIEMGGYIGTAPVCHGKLSWFESRHSLKITNGRNKQRNGQHTLASQKKKEDQSKILMLFRMKSSFELGDGQLEPRSKILMFLE
jgi:hypothetical protein